MCARTTFPQPEYKSPAHCRDVAQTFRPQDRRGEGQHPRAGATDACAMTSSSPRRNAYVPIPSLAKSCGSSRARKNSRSGQLKPAMEGRRQAATGRPRHLPDGAIYSNLFEGDGLYRVTMMRTAARARSRNCRPLVLSTIRTACERWRQAADGRRRDRRRPRPLTVDGDNAKIETIKDGFDGPVCSCRSATRSMCLTRP